MAFLNALDISGSGMTAQRMRLDIAAENIANINTTRTENGEPYRRQMVVFESIPTTGFGQVLRSEIAKQSQNSGGGVRVAEIVEDEREFESVYDPTHPDADENGYVQMPNVDLVKETIDSMAASRAYDANLTVFNTVKTMASKALEITTR